MCAVLFFYRHVLSGGGGVWRVCSGKIIGGSRTRYITLRKSCLFIPSPANVYRMSLLMNKSDNGNTSSMRGERCGEGVSGV